MPDSPGAPLKVEELRSNIDVGIVGFGPNTTSVKPVHLATGLFRVLAGKTSATRDLVRFAVAQDQSGNVPKGHDLEAVKARLLELDALESDISDDELTRLRAMVRKVLGADHALYTGGMDSHSAFGVPFLAKRSIGQDAGEFVADWMSTTCPELRDHLVASLVDVSDPITLLVRPVTVTDTATYERAATVQLSSCMEHYPEAAKALWEGMQESARSLEAHLVRHPSKLVRARLVTLFAGIVVVRYLASIESGLVPGAQPPLPILLCFNHEDRSIGDASKLSYQLVGQSLARFYAWAFGEEIKKLYSLEDLSDLNPPEYKKHEAQAKEIWATAKESARDSEDGFLVYGQALYDILAMEAEANPVTYLRALCVRLGIAYPTINAQPFKQFRPNHDLTELLFMGALRPTEGPLPLDVVLTRLWDRFGIVVGGLPEDQARLERAGIFRVDSDALRLNRDSLSTRLVELGIASKMADGVVEVNFDGRGI